MIFLTGFEKGFFVMLRTISIALIVFTIFLGAKTYAAEPAIRSFLNKKEISVGERIKLTVEMEWKQEEGSSIVITQITPPSSSSLEQVDSRQSTSSRLTKNGAVARTVMEYTYIGKEKGMGDITPAVIEYTFSGKPEDKRIIKAQPIPIKVISRAVRFRKMALKGILGMISAVLFFGVFALLKRRVISSSADKRNKTGSDRGCLEKEFCEKLRDLNKYKISGDTGAYYAGIEKAVFDYAKKKYNSDLSTGIGPPNPSKGGALSLENMDKLPKELQKICAECKFMSEKVRFSGYKPQENEQDRLIRGITKYMKPLMQGESEYDMIETID